MTIAVAMSGGVDSSVAASLLLAQGRSIIGLSMRLVDSLAGEEESYGRCCSPDDFRDARTVADMLGFPHYVLDFEKEFHREVLQPFAADYSVGRTPSPCILCNTRLKFGSLLARARSLGADKVATGHYAILEEDPVSGRVVLRKAADPDKDQSYFLFEMTEEQRRSVEFPLGSYTKEKVRSVALEKGLKVHSKRESMDLCFVPEGGDYRRLLDNNNLIRVQTPGDIVDLSGNVLGRHEGISRFTVGQRRKLGLSSDRKLYVVRIDESTNSVVIGGKDDLFGKRCTLERVNWIPFVKPDTDLRALVRIRSTHPGAMATVTDLGLGRAEVIFDEPQSAITPGQAAVAYDGDLVLGGGWITSAAN